MKQNRVENGQDGLLCLPGFHCQLKYVRSGIHRRFPSLAVVRKLSVLDTLLEDSVNYGLLHFIKNF